VLRKEEAPFVCPCQKYYRFRRRSISLEGLKSMMMCDCDDDEDATGDDRVAEIRSSGATGDVNSLSGEGFLRRFFDVGSEVGGQV
jgi:hypothetical protein